MSKVLPTHKDVHKSASKHMKSADGFLLIARTDGAYTLCCASMSKENMSWAVTLIQKELMKNA